MVNDVSIRTFLIKVTARCNINCSYCYEYNLADNSWKGKPKVIATDVIYFMIHRINEHISAHALKSIKIIFHGGEPLLMGMNRFSEMFYSIKSGIDSNIKIRYGIQSNGILINAEWLDFFLNNNISIGISIDGEKEINDNYRLDHRGNSTYDSTLKGIKKLYQDKYNSIRGGLLMVIQPKTNPVEQIKWLTKFGKTQVDFLLPHHNYNCPPNYTEDELSGFGYGEWLKNAFDYWWDNDISDLKIRFFEDIIHLLMGGSHSVESLGLSPVQILVIQSDGGYEAVDSLKSTYNGAVSTNKSVFLNKIDDVLDVNYIIQRINRYDSLSPKCKQCDLVKVCGGGYFPHRWNVVNGFNNPSIYCKDLYNIITHIKSKLRNYNQIIQKILD